VVPAALFGPIKQDSDLGAGRAASSERRIGISRSVLKKLEALWCKAKFDEHL